MDVKSQLDENQQKQYEWEQDQIAHMKEYIARFGHGSAKLAKQAQSKEKTLAKMQAGGLTEKVVTEKTVKLHFHQCGSLPPPVLQFTNVTFGYTPDKILYSKLDFGVDLDSRIALVGPNGAGKSTLLKLMVHELECLDGIVRRHPHLRIARFHQHLTDLLDPELTPLEYIIKEFAPMEPTVARSQIGRFGITGDAQTAKMKNLSDGQKSRVSSSSGSSSGGGGSSSSSSSSSARPCSACLSHVPIIRSPSPGLLRRNRTCCCWMSPRTTWTWRPSTAWRAPSTSSTAAACSSATTSVSSSRSCPALPARPICCTMGSRVVEARTEPFPPQVAKEIWEVAGGTVKKIDVDIATCERAKPLALLRS
jgi:uncharacterized membrane protein YgcG